MDIKEGKAGWDQRVAFHQRLHAAINTATRDSYNNDYVGWFKSLRVLKMSLVPHMEPEEKDSITTLLNKCYLLSIAGKNFNAEPFIQTQEELLQVMRNKNFDVPIGNMDGSL